MSTFDSAIPVILQHEGGWVSNPADPGGETNYGISTLIIKREYITPVELGIESTTMFQPGYLKPMQIEAAKEIYERLFWNKYQYGVLVNNTVATKVFDCSVNCGPGRAHLFAQKAANACGANLQVDGILGQHSFDAINGIDPKTYIHAYADQMRAYYNAIVLANPKLHVFLANWLHRASWGE